MKYKKLVLLSISICLISFLFTNYLRNKSYNNVNNLEKEKSELNEGINKLFSENEELEVKYNELDKEELEEYKIWQDLETQLKS